METDERFKMRCEKEVLHEKNELKYTKLFAYFTHRREAYICFFGERIWINVISINAKWLKCQKYIILSVTVGTRYATKKDTEVFL